jgi:hypothetical protein
MMHGHTQIKFDIVIKAAVVLLRHTNKTVTMKVKCIPDWRRHQPAQEQKSESQLNVFSSLMLP